MGLLQNDEMLSFEDTKKVQQIIKEKGIRYFFKTICKYRDLKVDTSFTSGQEVELIALQKVAQCPTEFPQFCNYNIDATSISTNSSNASVTSTKEMYTYLPLLELQDFEELSEVLKPQGFEVGHEYSNFQLEVVPLGKFDNLIQVMDSMDKFEQGLKALREFMSTKQAKEVTLVLASTQQMLGSEAQQRYYQFQKTSDKSHATKPLDEIQVWFQNYNEYSKSSLTLDDHINPLHPRFKTLTRNIRQFRGEKVAIERNNFKTGESLNLDSMMFGMGSNCFQYTFEVKSFTNACQLYDTQGVIAPLMLALGNSSPIQKGQFTDSDVRWNVISDCTDSNKQDSNPAWDDQLLNDTTNCAVNRKRYSSIPLYLTNSCPHLNDAHYFKYTKTKDIFLEQNCFESLPNKQNLMKHMEQSFSHPAVIAQNVDYSPENNDWDRIHYMNLISSNWNSVRLKLPEDDNVSYKIEFRPLELQPTIQQNVMFNCYMVLLTRSLLIFKPDLLIPISQVDRNLATAHLLNPIDQLYAFKNFDLKVAVLKFITDNKLDEKEFEKCVMDEHDANDHCQSHKKSVDLEIVCSEDNLDFTESSLTDIFFGPNGLDKLIQCQLAFQHHQEIDDPALHFQNHLQCTHHNSKTKDYNSRLINVQEEARRFVKERIANGSDSISSKLRNLYYKQEHNGNIDMEDYRQIIENFQL